VLLPREIQAIVDGCATWDGAAGDWAGNLRDRLIFALLVETGMRLGEVLGMAIGDFVMGRGGTAYVEVVPRPGNANDARVKMMRPRQMYISADLERLFADYLTHLACRAAALGLAVTSDSPLLVNLDRPPLLAAMREGTVRDKVAALKKKGIGPAGWTPHWFRHTHASALRWPGRRSGWYPAAWATHMCGPPWTYVAGSGKTRRCWPRRNGQRMRRPGWCAGER
jgi:integrase